MKGADRSKLGVTLVVFALAALALRGGLIDGDHWVAVMTWTVTAYMLGHVGAVVADGYLVQTQAKRIEAEASAKRG